MQLIMSTTVRPATIELGLFAGNILTDPIISDGAYKFDAQRFQWIGAASAAVNVCISSLTSKIKTFRDAIAGEMVIRAAGQAGNSTYDFPVLLNNVLGTDFKLVMGYAGRRSDKSCCLTQ